MLERLQWRNLPIEEIDKLIHIFTNTDIAEMKQAVKACLEDKSTV
ncbi:hypothetical protein [Duncaniella sp.]|nr:hypothetical protein [Duncaniella sp.]